MAFVTPAAAALCIVIRGVHPGEGALAVENNGKGIALQCSICRVSSTTFIALARHAIGMAKVPAWGWRLG